MCVYTCGISMCMHTCTFICADKCAAGMCIVWTWPSAYAVLMPVQVRAHVYTYVYTHFRTQMRPTTVGSAPVLVQRDLLHERDHKAKELDNVPMTIITR